MFPELKASLRTRNKLSLQSPECKYENAQFIFSGFAVDQPMSDRRRQQTYHIWELGIPELHSRIGPEPHQEWFIWVNSLDEATSLFHFHFNVAAPLTTAFTSE
ncbi:hypothetical protein BDV12DRAFT_197942 [Aspergillus spectabilis]